MGCYELSLGVWHRDSLQRYRGPTLPDTIVLTGAPAISDGNTWGYTRTPQLLGHELKPQIFHHWRHEITPAWQVSNDTVRLEWTDGFSGVSLYFTPGDAGLVGRVEVRHDIIITERQADGTERVVPWPSADVHVRHVPCHDDAAA